MKKKTITTLLLSLALLIGTLTAEENTTAKLLREALFAEEADRDLAKAEKAYREIVKKFDADRTYAATAILRLGEILNNRGQTAEAEKWYARVLQEFPDQEPIAKVAAARLGDKAVELAGSTPIKVDPQLDEVERLKKLLAQSPDLLDTPKDGTTPLVTAANRGQIQVVEFLLSKGVRINGDDSYDAPYPSALAAAVKHGHTEVIKRLIKAGAEPERGLIHLAVRSGNYAVTKLLLEGGADPNAYSTISLATNGTVGISGSASNQPSSTLAFERPEPARASSLGRVNWTPLEIATFFRFTKLTDLLLANKAKQQKRENHHKEWRFTEELRFAILDKNTELIAKLLDHKADPNSQWRGISAVAIAAKGGNAEIVTLLIEAGADVNASETSSGRTPLHWARGAAVQPLLSAGAAPNRPDNAGSNTPLHSTYDPTKAKALLAAGADVNALNSRGYSPVVHADIRILDILLATKPDLSLVGRSGTALGIAASGRHWPEPQGERIEKLIAAGADPNQVDKSGKTPLLLAVELLQHENAAALIAGGANPNGVANSPAPLSGLPKNRHIEPGESTKRSYATIVRTLIEAGADPNAVDSKGLTALMKVAGDSDDIETIRYLLGKGASPEVGGKFAFASVSGRTTARAELFLAAYLQPERRRGTIRVVSSKAGHIWEEVSAFVATDEQLPPCPYSLLEAYAFCDASGTISLSEVKVWREGEAEPLTFDLRKIITSGDPAQDVALAWGDLLEFNTPNSAEEAAVNTTGKEFLNSHLKRTVKFTHGEETSEVDLKLVWSKLPNTETWIRDKKSTTKSYFEEGVQTLSLAGLNRIGVKGFDILRNTPDKWLVKRSDAQKIEAPNRRPTMWLENGDEIGFEGKSAANAGTAAPASIMQRVKGRRVSLPPKQK